MYIALETLAWSEMSYARTAPVSFDTASETCPQCPPSAVAPAAPAAPARNWRRVTTPRRLGVVPSLPHRSAPRAPSGRSPRTAASFDYVL